MRDVIQQRVRDTKQKIEYFLGITDTHPQGWSGKRWIICYEESKRVNFDPDYLYGVD